MGEILPATGGYQVSSELSAAVSLDLIIPVIARGQDTVTLLVQFHAVAPTARLLHVLDE